MVLPTFQFDVQFVTIDFCIDNLIFSLAMIFPTPSIVCFHLQKTTEARETGNYKQNHFDRLEHGSSTAPAPKLEIITLICSFFLPFIIMGIKTQEQGAISCNATVSFIN